MPDFTRLLRYENNIQKIENFRELLRDRPLETKNKDNLFTKSNIHSFLSWCCIRNAEVYQDFANYLEGNRNKSKDSDLLPKIKGFFESVYKYNQATHDYIDSEDNLSYYKLNYAFVGCVLLMFEDEKNDPSDYIIVNTGTSVVDEKTNVKLLTDNKIKQRIFKNVSRGGTLRGGAEIKAKAQTLNDQISSDKKKIIDSLRDEDRLTRTDFIEVMKIF